MFSLFILGLWTILIVTGVSLLGIYQGLKKCNELMEQNPSFLPSIASKIYIVFS